MNRQTTALLYVITLLTVFVCLAMAAVDTPTEKKLEVEGSGDKGAADKKDAKKGADALYTLGSMAIAAVVQMF